MTLKTSTTSPKRQRTSSKQLRHTLVMTGTASEVSSVQAPNEKLDSTPLSSYLISNQPSTSPTTPRKPSSPNPFITPKPLNPPPTPPPGFIPELGDVYTACQAYIDSYIANNPASHFTPTIIANLHLDILKWRKELTASAHGQASLQSPQNRNASRLIRVLLERTFKGLAKYDPPLKKNVALVDGEVVGMDEIMGI